MTTKRLFPTSIVDEMAYHIEEPVRTSLTQGWVLTLKGEVSSMAIKEALDSCLNLYPKFKCILVKNYPSFKRWFRYCWEYQDIKSEDILQEIEDPDLDKNKDAISCYRHYYSSSCIDITRETPLRILLLKRSGLTDLVFLVHHVASDGIGFLYFLQKFIQLYEEIFYQRKKEGDNSPDYESISRPEIKFRWNHFTLRRIHAHLKHNALLRQEPPEQLSNQSQKETVERLLAVAQEILPDKFQYIRATAKKYKATINNYLLAAMFQTIKKWKQQQGEKSGRIYINVPVNLRPPEDRTVGNILSGFNISFRTESIIDKGEMLKPIRKQMTFLMESDIAGTAEKIAWFLKPIPLKIKRLMFKHHPHIFYPSLTLSNIGICSPNPLHKDDEGFHYIGPAQICSINFIGYAAPWPQIVVLTYNNRMTISLSVFRSQFSLESAESFLDSFVRELTG